LNWALTSIYNSYLSTFRTKGNWGLGTLLDKFEVSAVLHEILGVLGESVNISFVSLDYSGSKFSKASEDFLIKMRCDLDDCARKRIQPILERHNLIIEEKKGTLVINSL
jgi:hypothetical protein